MSFASRHRRGVNNFGVDNTDFDYISLAKLYEQDGDKPHKVLGIYINTKSTYGEQGIAILDGYNLNLPKHLTDDVKDILNSDDDVMDIIDGKVGLVVYPYRRKGEQKDYYSIRWIDL